MLVATVVLIAAFTRGTGQGISPPLQAAMVLLAAAVVIAVCLTRTNPLTLAARGAIMSRALWLFAREIAQGAWARRGRWRECVLRARGEV